MTGTADISALASAAGGTIEYGWPIDRILRVGDKATGTTVLTDLYAKMGAKPYAPDLDALGGQAGGVHGRGRDALDHLHAVFDAPEHGVLSVEPGLIDHDDIGENALDGARSLALRAAY